MAKATIKNKEKISAFSVKIPADLLEKARKKSAETGVAIAFILRKALEDWVKQN